MHIYEENTVKSKQKKTVFKKMLTEINNFFYTDTKHVTAILKKKCIFFCHIFEFCTYNNRKGQ